MQNTTDLFSIKNIIIYVIIINLTAFLSMYIDKKKAQKGSWRIKEATLMMFAVFGGSIGALAGMYTFRHKTKKLKFTIGIPTILISEIAMILFLLFR